MDKNYITGELEHTIRQRKTGTEAKRSRIVLVVASLVKWGRCRDKITESEVIPVVLVLTKSYIYSGFMNRWIVGTIRCTLKKWGTERDTHTDRDTQRERRKEERVSKKKESVNKQKM